MLSVEIDQLMIIMCVQGPSPPCHETSHNLREKDFRDHRQDRRHPRDRDADRSHVSYTPCSCVNQGPNLQNILRFIIRLT